jgi:hypothetical protein
MYSTAIEAASALQLEPSQLQAGRSKSITIAIYRMVIRDPEKRRSRPLPWVQVLKG